MNIDSNSGALAVVQEALGEFVRHPDAGPCRVVGVAKVERVGWVCRLERISPLLGAVSVPLERISDLGLVTLTAAEAASLATRWEQEQAGKSRAGMARRRGVRKAQATQRVNKLAARLKRERSQ